MLLLVNLVYPTRNVNIHTVHFSTDETFLKGFLLCQEDYYEERCILLCSETALQKNEFLCQTLHFVFKKPTPLCLAQKDLAILCRKPVFHTKTLHFLQKRFIFHT